jgi:hypothetical protein
LQLEESAQQEYLKHAALKIVNERTGAMAIVVRIFKDS